jgi:hypothetical protein
MALLDAEALADGLMEEEVEGERDCDGSCDDEAVEEGDGEGEAEAALGQSERTDVSALEPWQTHWFSLQPSLVPHDEHEGLQVAGSVVKSWVINTLP